MEPQYRNVKPLVANQEDDYSGVRVSFRCPSTGTEVQSNGSWPADSTFEQTAKQSKRSFFNSVRYSIASSVRMAAPAGMLGNLAGNAASNMVTQTGSGYENREKHSDKDREEAVVDAFRKVQGQFTWDDHQARWVAAGASEVQVSPFTEQLINHPLVTDWDNSVLTRLLAALVAADGQIGDDERASFAALAPGANLDELAARRAPSAVDFEETSGGPTRDTILLLGWAVALSDESYDEREGALLATAAQGLGITDLHAEELRVAAQQHIVEEAVAVLARQGMNADQIRDEVEPLGERIGFGADEAARAVIRWSKRNS